MSAKPVLPACLAVAAALVLVGCVNQNTWSPTVDPYTDVNAARRGTDEAQCRQIATQASGGST
jgi:outer membrane lipoprotein SlyB